MEHVGAHETDLTALGYDAFGLIGTTFRELDWKTLIFFERAAPIRPFGTQGFLTFRTY
jgi:hypothetical protein